MVLEKNSLKSVIPFIGTLMVILGYVKLSIFYSYFNLNISDFLDITEIIALFFSDIIAFSLIAFGFFLFIFLFEPISEKIKTHEFVNTIFETQTLSGRLIKYYKLNKFLAWLSLIFIVSFIVHFFLPRENNNHLYFAKLIFPISYILSLVTLEFRYKYKLIYKKDYNATYVNLIVVFIFFCYYIVETAAYNIERIYRKADKEVSFTNEDKDIKTNENFKFLGQTKNYLFIYNKKIDETTVFKRDVIKNFKVKTIKD